MNEIEWTIDLPEAWETFVAQRGEGTTFFDDIRQHRRLKAPSYGILWFALPWNAVTRPAGPLGIYTRDFSQRGCGLLCPIEVYPEEVLRVLLPTFWMTVRVVRCRRVNPHCYDLGATLVRQFAPSEDAFESVAEAPASATPVASVGGLGG